MFTVTRGLNLPKSIKMLRTLEYDKLNRERSESIGGKASDVVIIMPYNAQLSQSDKEYCLEQLKYMRQEIPGYKKTLLYIPQYILLYTL